MSEVFDVLAQAIQQRKQVTAIYQGLFREMCPHVLGFKNGREQCLFYQFGGESSKSLFPLDHPNARLNWRCLVVAELSSLEIRDGIWHSISWHTRPQTCVDVVTFQVQGWAG
jgi:hypothetical protein